MFFITKKFGKNYDKELIKKQINIKNTYKKNIFYYKKAIVSIIMAMFVS